jgi:Iron-containing alcohol dehydrogenase
MHNSGTHLFPRMDRVIFGTPATEALVAEVSRLKKRRVFLMVSHTLNTATEEIRKIQRALGERYAGSYDSIPQHTSRQGAVAAARAALAAEADLIVAIGGGSVIDASKIMRICMEHKILEPEGLDGFQIKVSPDRQHASGVSAAVGTHDRDPQHAVGRRMQRRLPRHRSGAKAEADLLPSVDDPPRERADRGEANENHRTFASPKIVTQMVADAAAGAHAGAGQDDCATGDAVDRHRIRSLAG